MGNQFVVKEIHLDHSDVIIAAIQDFGVNLAEIL
jgi:hypothetical protein